MAFILAPRLLLPISLGCPGSDVAFPAVGKTPTENVLPSEPSAMQVLLLCAHVVSHLVLASATPQATTAQQCPALEVTWSLGEAPSSKELC